LNFAGVFGKAPKLPMLKRKSALRRLIFPKFIDPTKVNEIKAKPLKKIIKVKSFDKIIKYPTFNKRLKLKLFTKLKNLRKLQILKQAKLAVKRSQLLKVLKSKYPDKFNNNKVIKFKKSKKLKKFIKYPKFEKRKKLRKFKKLATQLLGRYKFLFVLFPH
jgi:hypothetical protein